MKQLLLFLAILVTGHLTIITCYANVNSHLAAVLSHHWRLQYINMQVDHIESNHDSDVFPMRFCIQLLLQVKFAVYDGNFELPEMVVVLSYNLYGSFITYWIRKIWLCETLFWYNTVWIIVFWFHTKSQHQQIFKLRGRTSNEIWAITITISHNIQFWMGYCTFKRTVWNRGSTIERIWETFALRDFASWECGWSLAQISEFGIPLNWPTHQDFSK